MTEENLHELTDELNREIEGAEIALEARKLGVAAYYGLGQGEKLWFREHNKRWRLMLEENPGGPGTPSTFTPLTNLTRTRRIRLAPMIKYLPAELEKEYDLQVKEVKNSIEEVKQAKQLIRSKGKP